MSASGTLTSLAQLTVKVRKHSRTPTPVASIIPVEQTRDVHPRCRVTGPVRKEDRTKHVQHPSTTVVVNGLGVCVLRALTKLRTKPPQRYPTSAPLLARLKIWQRPSQERRDTCLPSIRNYVASHREASDWKTQDHSLVLKANSHLPAWKMEGVSLRVPPIYHRSQGCRVERW
jgi:hypothetical protein